MCVDHNQTLCGSERVQSLHLAQHGPQDQIDTVTQVAAGAVEQRADQLANKRRTGLADGRIQKVQRHLDDEM